ISAKRHVVLRNLIVLRQIGIEIVFAIELADGCDVASEHESSQHRHAQRLMIHHWQCTGQTEANRANVRVRFRSELNGRSAKHLRSRLELIVLFEAGGPDLLHSVLYSRQSVEALKTRVIPSQARNLTNPRRT